MTLLETSHPAGLHSPKVLLEKHKDQTSVSHAEIRESSSLPAGTGPSSEDAYAVLSARNLLFDICNQNGGGHGGSAIGMAAIGVALYKYAMRYNPSNPQWFDRDRFVLSNGHAAMFLYAFNHLVGYDDWTMEELKGYGSAKLNGFTTLCHAHPEIEVPGVEVTTGPLGQGVANAVGLAIASKNLAAKFNQPGYDIVQSRIFCTTGDGCLMEGVALEAISLAGHLQLDNLVLIYDNNQITCDGPLDWINTEDVNSKMRASGWCVLEIDDGNHDVSRIVAALDYAGSVRGKPVFINIRTVIGVGTGVAGTAKAHHGLFDKESVAKSKAAAGVDPNATYQVPSRALSYFRERKAHGEKLNAEWDQLVEKYGKDYPDSYQTLQRRRTGKIDNEVFNVLDSIDSSTMQQLATRESNGLIMEKVWPLCESLCGGGADLANSNKIYQSATDVFLPSNYGGRYIRYGIREHAMASISNGIAAYNPGTFLPITATFLMFYLYAAPGVRMGALSHLQALHFATHDSFAEGQNGPTHQPVEVDSLYRAMPNIVYFRPCDAEEVLAAWKSGLLATTRPTMISLGRDPMGIISGTSRQCALKGAYVLRENSNAAVTLASCGTCMHHVVAAADRLEASGIRTRLVSAPSLDLFEEQSEEHKRSVFPTDGWPIVSVEEYVATTWARYATGSIGMTTFGYSASGAGNYTRFGLDAPAIEQKVRQYLTDLDGGDARQAGWKRLA